jgi:hypothetical protein
MEMKMMPRALRLAAAAAAIGIMSVGALSQASAQTPPRAHSRGYAARAYQPPPAHQDYSGYSYSYGGYGNRGGCSDSPAEC